MPAVDKYGIDGSTPDADIQKIAGHRIYHALNNLFSDIETMLNIGVQSSKAIGDELCALLVSELPGETIIGFEAADIAAMATSPLEAARHRASSQRGAP